MKTKRDEQWETIRSLERHNAAGITHFLWGYLVSAEAIKRSITVTEILDMMARQASKELQDQNKREAVCVS